MFFKKRFTNNSASRFRNVLCQMFYKCFINPCLKNVLLKTFANQNYKMFLKRLEQMSW